MEYSLKRGFLTQLFDLESRQENRHESKLLNLKEQLEQQQQQQIKQIKEEVQKLQKLEPVKWEFTDRLDQAIQPSRAQQKNWQDNDHNPKERADRQGDSNVDRDRDGQKDRSRSDRRD
ncbi:uncharacterized protein LOC108675818, partial [Hyalella azteca]|uniref:Uncharacterized protein LOC108675818 n=1 Tax=Hyalella azteca TaxID=294128 RepID=A0A8B7P041_HYAAZ